MKLTIADKIGLSIAGAIIGAGITGGLLALFDQMLG